MGLLVKLFIEDSKKQISVLIQDRKDDGSQENTIMDLIVPVCIPTFRFEVPKNREPISSRTFVINILFYRSCPHTMIRITLAILTNAETTISLKTRGMTLNPKYALRRPTTWASSKFRLFAHFLISLGCYLIIYFCRETTLPVARTEPQMQMLTVKWWKRMPTNPVVIAITLAFANRSTMYDSIRVLL